MKNVLLLGSSGCEINGSGLYGLMGDEIGKERNMVEVVEEIVGKGMREGVRVK